MLMTEPDPRDRRAEERFYNRPYVQASSGPGCWSMAIAALGWLIMTGSGLCSGIFLTQSRGNGIEVVLVLGGVPFLSGLVLVILAYAIGRK